MPEFCYVIVNSVVAFVYLFIVSKIMGKKQIAQLTFIDYAIGISIGSIAAEFATDTKNPWYFYIIAISIFTFFSVLISLLLRKAQFLKKIFQGKPLVLIKDGKIDFDELKKSKLDVYDLLSLARTKNYFNINDIAYAIFETDGELSILPTGNQRPTVAEDFKEIKLEQASLSIPIVLDGKIVKSGLKELQVNEKWVFGKLGVINKEQLKNIALAIYDEKLDKFDVHYKTLQKNKNINQQEINNGHQD